MSESAMSGDAAMRADAATLPVPEFETTAFVPLDKPPPEASTEITGLGSPRS
jgi:hypothetical protein